MKPEPSETKLASSVTGRKVNRPELAAYLGISLRHLDELTRNGALPVFKLGKSVRFDLDEVEAALRERFHVKAKTRRTGRRTSPETINQED